MAERPSTARDRNLDGGKLVASMRVTDPEGAAATRWRR
jgi:hypothetical protein